MTARHEVTVYLEIDMVSNNVERVKTVRTSSRLVVETGLERELDHGAAFTQDT